MDGEQHSRIAPSSAGVWVKCPGSVVMQENSAALSNERSQAALEGEASHWVAASRLTSGAAINVGDVAPNGVILTQEMIDCAMVYANHAWDAIKDIPHCKPHVEEKIEAPGVHENSWGSVDYWAFDSRDLGTLYVKDYKYGYGLVEVYENWQMINYTLGVLGKLSPQPNTVIHITIVQPRPYHIDGPVRTWSLTAVELQAYAVRLATAAQEALGPDPRVVSGPHCRYCRARHACPAAHKAAMTALDVTSQAAIESLKPEALSYELTILRRAKEAIDYRLTGVEAQALAATKNGVNIPGWAVRPGVGRKKWLSPTEEVFMMGDLAGVDLRKAPEPLTPTQAINAGIPSELVALYSAPSEGKVKLVPDDGSRAKAILGGK